MKKIINIDSIDAKSIVGQLGDDLEVTVDKDGADYCFDLPDSTGEGYLRGINFSHGLSLLEGVFSPKKDIRFVFENQNVNPLIMMFNVHEEISLIESKKKKQIPIDKMKCGFFASGTETYFTLEFKRKISNNVFALVINRKELEGKLDSITSDFSNEDKKLFKDVNGVISFYDIDFFSLEIGQMIDEIRHCNIENLMKPMFIEGKAYEILSLQLQYFKDRDNRNDSKKFLRKNTVEKIEEAIEIIDKELDQRINVHSLANRVGLNQNTLQNGFKNLFKSSVNSYIKDKRLEMAKVLIEDNELNLTEITYKIGINSRSYFSKLFKEKFGISPSAYIAQTKRENSQSA